MDAGREARTTADQAVGATFQRNDSHQILR
jgi:hypothetical protein